MMYIYTFLNKSTGLIHRTILSKDDIQEAYRTAYINEADAELMRKRTINPVARLKHLEK